MIDTELTILDVVRCFKGKLHKCQHTTSSLGGLTAKFMIFIPDVASPSNKVPQLLALQGLTSTEENFMMKAGAMRHASKVGLAMITPDTSPRGANIAGEDTDWDFGTGAGFYLNATQEPWAKHYNMYDYVTKELPQIVHTHFHVDEKKRAIFGHSVGGLGALNIAMKNPGTFSSVSVVAPVANPTKCPWGVKAFTGYLGPDKATWNEWDPVELMSTYEGPQLNLLIEQGSEDSFINTQLFHERLVEKCKEKKMKHQYNLREGYDHSYYYIQTFIDEIIDHHMAHF
eukprot:GHVN01105628.1.p1 GENE.GHVN01105628.1~~GHVN01105628.1.p1  ORF type:complete len:285 (+),score=42.77 GHVN01105628.1:51-905(+)